MALVRKLDVQIGGDATRFLKSLGTVERAAINAGKILAGVGVGIGVVSIKRAATFSEGLANLNTVAKLSEGELAALGESVKAISNEFGASKTDLLIAGYQALSKQVPTDELSEFLLLATKLGKVGQGTTADAVEAMTRLKEAFPEKSDGEIANAALAAVEEGSLTLAELGQNIGRVSGVAASAGVGLKELLASTAALSRSGVATEAITNLNQAILKLANPSKELADALGKAEGTNLIREFGGLEEVLAALQKTGKTAINELAPLFKSETATKGIVELLKRDGAAVNGILDSMGGKADRVAESTARWAQNNDKLQFDQLMQQLDSMAITIGGPLIKELSALVEQMSSLTQNKDDLDTIVQGFVAIAGVALFLVDIFAKLLGLMERVTEFTFGNIEDAVTGASAVSRFIGSPVTKADQEAFERAAKGGVVSRELGADAGAINRGLVAFRDATGLGGRGGEVAILNIMLQRMTEQNVILKNQLPPAPAGGS